MVERIDSTSMMVTWDKLSLVDLKGLANYTVTYSVSGGGGSRKRQVDQGTMTVPWTENSVTIRNLRSGAAYDVSVQTVTSMGPSGMCVCISASISGTLRDIFVPCIQTVRSVVPLRQSLQLTLLL